MPSARQVARLLATRGVVRPEHKEAIEIVSDVLARLGPQASAEAVVYAIRDEADQADLQALGEIVVHVLAAMEEIEQTYVPNQELTAADVRTKATQRELEREQ